jgi:hypothetical protein
MGCDQLRQGLVTEFPGVPGVTSAAFTASTMVAGVLGAELKAATASLER